MKPTLVAAVEDVLLQGSMLLNALTDEEFTQTEGTGSRSTVGSHYRHVLDHFVCLLEGIKTGEVNYDHRRRNPVLEKSVTAARVATEDLIREFRGLTSETLRSNCFVMYTVGYGEDGIEKAPSNVAREVMFCVGHAIHHYAILKLLCTSLGVKLPYEFGVAPSTLKYQEEQLTA